MTDDMHPTNDKMPESTELNGATVLMGDTEGEWLRTTDNVVLLEDME